MFKGRQIKILFLILFFVSILILLNYVSFDFVKKPYLPIDSVIQNDVPVEKSFLNLTINSGLAKDKTAFDIEFNQGEKLVDILKRGLKTNEIPFETKNFGGMMGEFVVSIEGYSNEKNKWWQYWINDKYAKVGISNYYPKKDDRIVFKLVEYSDSYEN